MSFKQSLIDGHAFRLNDVKVVLDQRGSPFRWSSYECLHCEELSLRHEKGCFVLTGEGRFEVDHWSRSMQGDSSEKADCPCRIDVIFEWPDKTVRDASKGVAMIPGRLRAVLRFLEKAKEGRESNL